MKPRTVYEKAVQDFTETGIGGSFFTS
jgi:hypothetical protein